MFSIPLSFLYSLWQVACFITLVAIPLYLRLVCGLHNFDLSATKRIRVHCRRSTASRYLRDTTNLMDYEMKVLQSTVVRTYPDGSGLDYRLQGYAMGILWWRSTFSMKFLGCGGFWSQCIGGPVSYVLPPGSPSGGFWLRVVDETTTDVTHTEKYLLPWGTPLGIWIAPLWRVWLQRSMEVEMEIIKESLEWLEGSPENRDTASRLPRHHPAVARFRSQRYGLLDLAKECMGGAKMHLADCVVYN